MPAASLRHGQDSSSAIWRRRCMDLSTRSCPIRLTSRPPRSPRWLRTCAISIRIWRSTAAPMGLISIAPSPRQRPPCWRPAGFWSSSLASARRNRSLIYLQRRGLRRHRRAPTLMGRHAPSLHGNGHEREALDPGKNAHGGLAKKHLEYRPEPTSLRPRNRPEMMVPRRLECPEQAFLRVRLPEVGSAGPAKSESRKAKAGTDGRRDRHHSYRDVHRSARICTEQSRAQRGVCNTAVKPRARAAIAEDTL